MTAPPQETPEVASSPKSVSTTRSTQPSGDGRRAAFLDTLPEDPELQIIIEAFVEGNYARVRALVPELLAHHKDSAVREAASELGRRIEPDPLAKYLLGISFVLFCALVAWAYLHH